MCTTDSEWVSDPKLYKTWRVEEFGTLQSGGEVFDVSDHPCHPPVPAVVTKTLSLGSECPRKGTPRLQTPVRSKRLCDICPATVHIGRQEDNSQAT